MHFSSGGSASNLALVLSTTSPAKRTASTCSSTARSAASSRAVAGDSSLGSMPQDETTLGTPEQLVPRWTSPIAMIAARSLILVVREFDPATIARPMDFHPDNDTAIPRGRLSLVSAACAHDLSSAHCRPVFITVVERGRIWGVDVDAFGGRGPPSCWHAGADRRDNCHTRFRNGGSRRRTL